jgi:integrase
MIERVEEQSRDGVLDDAEVRRFWLATNHGSPVFRDIMPVLMLTGQRRVEVGRMQFSEIDLATATWDVPGERTKNKRKHHVPLSAPAVEILRRYK